MAKESLSGKLAVILHADVAGSTQMVQQDEHLTHERIRDAFQRFSDKIKQYSGRVLELRGDALIAEFERPSDAVVASLAFQMGHSEFLSSLNDNLKPAIRTGIAMGEVVIADNTVTGAGVIMAQRVEQLADVSGVCITSTVQELLPKRLPIEFTNLGEQNLKGFDDLVRVFRVKLGANESVPPPQSRKPIESPRALWKQVGLTIVVVLMIVAGITFWTNTNEQQEESVSVKPTALPLPDKPSIAVLPFNDLSAETPKKSPADGLTETLISTLGQVSDLFVIARNSVMAYKGQGTDVREIGRQLGVRYVLEGSVQQAGDKVRVTAQLVDATTGGQLWSERYDRQFGDIFHLQDEIALKVLVSLQVQLTDGEVARLRSSTTKNVEAYLIYQKGVDVFFTFTKEAMVETRQLMDEALKLDPNFASALILKAWTHVNDAEFGYTSSRDGSIALAEDELERMENLGLEQTVLASGEALMIRGYIQLLLGNQDRAVEYGERSIALLPNHPDMLAIFGMFLHYAGNNKFAIEILRKAMRIDPNYKAWFARTLMTALVLIEDFDAAEIAAHDAIERASKEGERSLAFAHQHMAIVYMAQGKVDLGKKEIRHALELAPWLNLQSFWTYTYFRDERDLERFVGALRTAGLPE